MDERIDIGLLHHILDVVLVLHDGADDAVEPLIVAAHEDLEQGTLTGADQFDDLHISQGDGGREELRCVHVVVTFQRVMTLMDRSNRCD